MFLWSLIIFTKILLSSSNGWDKNKTSLTNWNEGVKNYLANNLEYQQFIILENRNISKNLIVGEIFLNFKNHPYLIATLDDFLTNNIENPNLNVNPRKTTVFVLIFSSLQPNFEVSMKFIDELSNKETKPKCLLFHLSGRMREFFYKHLLEQYWANNFLDVTIVEMKKISLENFLGTEETFAVLHQLNPFSKIYTREELSKSSELFPEKTRNLFGYSVQYLGVSHYSVNWSIPDSKVEQFGGDMAMHKVIAEQMNFSRNIRKTIIKKMGPEGCYKENYTGLLRGLVENEYRVFINLNIVLFCKRTQFLSSRIISLESSYVVVPKIVKNEMGNFNLIETCYEMLLLLSCFSFAWIFSNVWKFDRRLLDIIEWFSIILAMPSEIRTENLRERLFFSTLLIAGTMSSCYFYTILSSINFQIDSEEFRTLEDVDNSGLPIWMNKNWYVTLIDDDEVFQFSDFDNKVHTFDPARFHTVDCLRSLIKFKNVSCGLGLRSVQSMLRVYFKEFDEIRLKVIPYPLIPSVMGWLYEPGFPFAENYNRIMQRLIENGLLDKWALRMKFDENLLTNRSVDNVQIVKLQQLLYCILLVGFCLSILIFLVEVLVCGKK